MKDIMRMSALAYTAELARTQGFRWFHLALILLAGMASYANTFDVPFQFDDYPNIVENRVIKDMKYMAEPSLAVDMQGGKYLKRRYVGFLSFALNYRLHGLDVRGYHAVNLAIHLLAALTVYALVLVTFRTPALSGSRLGPDASSIALCTGLLFVCHPVQTQAVTYIVQRFSSLAALFYSAALVTYALARMSAERKRMAMLMGASALLGLLAFKTKENSLTLPLAAGLYECLFFHGRLTKRLACVIPLLLVATLALIGVFNVNLWSSPAEFLSQFEQTTRLHSGIERHHYLYTQFAVIATYIGLLVMPLRQNLDYDFPIYTSLADPHVFLPALLLLSIAALAGYLLLYASRRHSEARVAAFGILLFFIALSIESSVFPIRDLIFEHRLYLPSIGFFLAISIGAFSLLRRGAAPAWPRAHFAGWQKRPAPIIIILLLVPAMAFATHKRNVVWQDEVALWSDTAAQSPAKSRVLGNLGNSYLKRNDAGKAIIYLNAALALDPDNTLFHYSIAMAYSAKGRQDKAMLHYNLVRFFEHKATASSVFKALYDAALKEPDNPVIHYSLSRAYAEMGRRDEASMHLRTARELAPAVIAMTR